MDTCNIDRYADYLAAGGRGESTVKLRRSHLVRAAREIGTLESATTDKLISYLSRPEWRPATRRSYRASLRGFYRWATATGEIDADPADGLPTVIQPRALPRPADDAIIAAAIASAPPRVQLMLELMAYAGLRRCEVARVHARDVIVTDRASALRVTGKGGHTRIVPIPGHLARRVAKLRTWAFPGNDHGHLSAAHVGKLVSRALPPGVTGHMLRHRYATEGYRRSRDIRAIQELLGHAKLDTTMVYTRVDVDQVTAAASSTWTLAS